MHSPIIYLIAKDQFDDPTLDTKRDHLKTLIKEQPSDFEAAIPESDWYELDTTSDETWHRWKWDIENVLNADSKLYSISNLSNQALPKVLSITEEHILNFQSEKVEILQRYVNDLRAASADGRIYNPFTADSINNYLDAWDHIGKSSGGLVFGIINLKHGYVDFIRQNQMYDPVRMSSGISSTNEFVIVDDIQGDYHY